jgi:iron complex transport system substrate-binding protein
MSRTTAWRTSRAIDPGGRNRGPDRGTLARGWRVLAVLCLVALPWGAVAQPLTLRDDRGVEVRLAAPPQRIVSLLPSLTESVCALGACDRLVGVDRHSNHPPSVTALPQLGGLDDSNIERIVALQPDLVLLGVSARVVERLEALGLRVAALEPRNQAGVRQVLNQLDQLLGTQAAGPLWQRLQADIDAAARQVPAAARGLRIYHEVASGPYAAGEASYIGEIQSRLGLRNVVPARLGPFPKLNPEFVVQADPQLIMLSDRNPAALDGRPGWHALRAVREQRVCRFSAAEGDVLARPGPRMGEAAQLIVRCLQRVLAR